MAGAVGGRRHFQFSEPGRRQLRTHPAFAQHTESLTIKRLVIVPGKIANIVTR